jgi:hypothetical protein
VIASNKTPPAQQVGGTESAQPLKNLRERGTLKGVALSINFTQKKKRSGARVSLLLQFKENLVSKL